MSVSENQNSAATRGTLTERQADEGWCCRDECCGPASWCCSHANPDHACAGDDELPGMWEHSDFTGGREEVRGPDWTPDQSGSSREDA